MRKFFVLDLYDGKMSSISESDFNEMISNYREHGGTKKTNKKDGVTTYRFEEEVIIEMIVGE